MTNTPIKHDSKIPSATTSELNTQESKPSTPRSNPSISSTSSNAETTEDSKEKACIQASSSATNASGRLSPKKQEAQAMTSMEKLDVFFARAYHGNGFTEEKLAELKQKEKAEQGHSTSGKFAKSPNPSPSRSKFSLWRGLDQVTDAYMTSKASSKTP